LQPVDALNALPQAVANVSPDLLQGLGSNELDALHWALDGREGQFPLAGIAGKLADGVGVYIGLANSALDGDPLEGVLAVGRPFIPSPLGFTLGALETTAKVNGMPDQQILQAEESGLMGGILAFDVPGLASGVAGLLSPSAAEQSANSAVSGGLDAGPQTQAPSPITIEVQLQPNLPEDSSHSLTTNGMYYTDDAGTTSKLSESSNGELNWEPNAGFTIETQLVPDAPIMADQPPVYDLTKELTSTSTSQASEGEEQTGASSGSGGFWSSFGDFLSSLFRAYTQYEAAKGALSSRPLSQSSSRAQAPAADSKVKCTHGWHYGGGPDNLGYPIGGPGSCSQGEAPAGTGAYGTKGEPPAGTGAYPAR
jgi:hypothetical protein